MSGMKNQATAKTVIDSVSKVPWEQMPEDAQFYSGTRFRKLDNELEFYWDGSKWHKVVHPKPLDWHRNRFDFEMRPTTQDLEQDQKEKTKMTTDVLDERQKTYGDFSTLAHSVESMESYLKVLPGYTKATPGHREAAHMIIQKLVRSMNGDPHYTDSWHDISGYARLAEKECQPPAIGLNTAPLPPETPPTAGQYRTQWLPSIGDVYYYRSNTGYVNYRSWQNTPQEQKRLASGQVFKTRQEAESSDPTAEYIFHENDPVSYPEDGDHVWIIYFDSHSPIKEWKVSQRFEVGTDPEVNDITMTRETAMNVHAAGHLFKSEATARAKALWFNTNGRAENN